MRASPRMLAAALAAFVIGCDEGAGSNPDPLHPPGSECTDPNDPACVGPERCTDPSDPRCAPPEPPEPVPPEPPYGPPPGPRSPTNTKLDSDCDGLTDAEEWGNVYAVDARTNAGDWDSDKDGLRDGLEVGRATTLNTLPQCLKSFRADLDPSSRTNPTNPDTDGDGILDGTEDRNHNGRLDPGETDPANRDSDGDGLLDGEEDANHNGQRDPGETDPRKRDSDDDKLSDATEVRITHTDPLRADTDGDSCLDGAEDVNGNGVKDPGETDPKDGSDCGGGALQDTDGDGLLDSIEDANHNGVRDGNETDWRNPDTDGDGLKDGLEDRNHNGSVDSGETDPRSKDSDCDGLLDGPHQPPFLGEDLNANGVREPSETDPTQRDTDHDGLVDGVERGVPTSGAPVTSCGYVGDQDPSTTTDPLNPDSDGDGIADGAEDSNQNGRTDPGELDPRNSQDGSGPAGQACAARNMREVSFKEDNGGDIRLALRPTFQEVRQITVGGKTRGLVGYDETHQVAFVAFKRGQAGSSTTVAGDELYVRGQFAPSVKAGTTQTFTAWDGYPALQAFYDQSSPVSLRDYANSVANSLVGAGAGSLVGGAATPGPFKLQAQYVHRSHSSVLVVVAITPAARFVEPGLFVMSDTAGGTALAQFGDTDASQCEPFTTGNGMADFLFVVDDSGSMATSQSALGNAAAAVANRLGNSQLDWRIAMVTTSYTQTGYGLPNGGVFRGFTRDINQFKAWLQKDAACPDPKEHCWVDVTGSSDELTLASARVAVDYMTSSSTAAAKKYRPGAKLVVIALTDVRDMEDNPPVSTYIDYFKGANPTGQLIQMHGIICDSVDGGECYPGEPITNLRHKDVIQATGGLLGSIRSTASIQNTIGAIVDSVIASTGYRTLKPPIGASVRVAVEAVQDPTQCNAGDLPRSRVNGFDVDGISQALAFYGACRPAAAGSTRAAISYRYWSDLTRNPEGSPPPCSTDTGYYDPSQPDFCKGHLACNRQTNRCECPSDCGGGGAPGTVCNTNKDVCDFSCGSECGGACGSFQACDISTCSCKCAASASCSPGFKFDPTACGCVCDTAALNCGASYQSDANACACICKDNCGGTCASNTVCNMSSCSCEPKLN
jgi:hypothetical protein